MKEENILPKHIHLFQEDKYENGKVAFEKGWYFSDETADLHGPFSTIEETKELYEHYIKQL